MSLFLRRSLMAILFFTRIPLPMNLARWMHYSPALQAQCLRHWPGVGAVLGLLAASALVLIYHMLPQTTGSIWVAVIVSTGLVMCFTGALHEDGLADFTDALGGGNNKDKMLSIMKDSRIGSFGALALFMAVFCKTALLVALLETKLTGASTGLILAHVCSRCPPLWIAYFLPYARQAEQSKTHFSTETDPTLARSNALVGSVWLGLCLICCYPYLGVSPLLLVLLGVVLPNLWLFRCLKHRLQGFTGDTLGASQQLGELGAYFGLLYALGLTP